MNEIVFRYGEGVKKALRTLRENFQKTFGRFPEGWRMK